MKETARFFKRNLGFYPVDRNARELLAAVTEGSAVFLQVWRPRNMAQHRKYFAILNNVVEATGEWTSTEDLRFEVLRALRRGEDRVSPVDGSIRFIPESMAVASMPRAEFERLYDDTMKWLTDRYQCDPEMLLEEAA